MGTKEENRRQFVEDYVNRIMEKAGWTKEQAMLAVGAENIDASINEGFNGAEAADEEMACWTNDE
jgi:hypothetical protein